MNYEKIIKKYIDEFGSVVSYAQDGTNFTVPYKAFVQPLRYKNKMYLDGKHSEIGYIDTSYYLYLGPADVDVCNNDIYSKLKLEDNLYNITHAEIIRLGQEKLYIWAIIRCSFNN